MRIHPYFAPAIAVVAIGCADGTPAYVGEEVTLEASTPPAAVTAPVVPQRNEGVGSEGWMSSTCTTMMSADQLWGALQTGYYDLYVLQGLDILGEQEFQERTGTGVLESRALRISLDDAKRVVNISGSNAEDGFLFLEDSRVFRSDDGSVFREHPCDRAESVEHDGSLSSRVLAGNSRSIVLLVQSTSQLGSVIRDVAVVVGDTIRLAEGQEVSLVAIEEAAASIRVARSASQE